MWSSMTKFCLLGSVETTEIYFPGNLEIFRTKHWQIPYLGSAHILVHRLRFTAVPTQSERE